MQPVRRPQDELVAEQRFTDHAGCIVRRLLEEAEAAALDEPGV